MDRTIANKTGYIVPSNLYTLIFRNLESYIEIIRYTMSACGLDLQFAVRAKEGLQLSIAVESEELVVEKGAPTSNL